MLDDWWNLVEFGFAVTYTSAPVSQLAESLELIWKLTNKSAPLFLATNALSTKLGHSFSPLDNIPVIPGSASKICFTLVAIFQLTSFS